MDDKINEDSHNRDNKTLSNCTEDLIKLVFTYCKANEKLPKIVDTIKDDKATSLDLSGIELKDAGVKALVDWLPVNDRFTAINLAHNNIGDPGAEALAEWMPKNKIVTTLDISHNKINSLGLKLMLEAHLGRKATRIKQLDLGHNVNSDSLQEIWKEVLLTICEKEGRKVHHLPSYASEAPTSSSRLSSVGKKPS